MYLAINYRTKPLVDAWLSTPQDSNYSACFAVRDHVSPRSLGVNWSTRNLHKV
ncbi:hypothetical protein [Sphingomonas sp. GC_Shp_3]|uniref:hypothetical protein n=1 Tax=Sphingomonas sp. GC_Shp_3 TaxID=2937383 RepID=UPI00226AF998|nr:hypothetical protein [Sphingomonas sp. GC_Shp_3]